MTNNSDFIQMLMMLSKMTPFEDLVDKVEESIQRYKSDKCTETKSSVEMNCLMLTLKRGTEGEHSIQKARKMMDDVTEGTELLHRLRGEKD